MDGDLPVRFDVRPPPADLARANMGVNEARGIVEAVQPRTAIIIGSGPSARDEALWRRLRNLALPVVALNGALSLFLERGMKPDYWCVCDPQEVVADFLPADPPRGVIYLLASKCHPAVFDKLRGRDVRLWRLDDYEVKPGALAVPCACSITLVAQGLLRLMGFTTFEMYGWDCCFLGGEHHAVAQGAPLPEHCHEVELRREDDNTVIERFDTTGTWMAESVDAEIQARNFRAMGLRLIVHGPGMVGAILRGKGLSE